MHGSADDKMFVIASDGVFEFLTNQSVVDMCCKFTDPLEACRAVVAESYELWLQVRRAKESSVARRERATARATASTHTHTPHTHTHTRTHTHTHTQGPF